MGSGPACSFCGADRMARRVIVASLSRSVYICDRCVAGAMGFVRRREADPCLGCSVRQGVELLRLEVEEAGAILRAALHAEDDVGLVDLARQAAELLESYAETMAGQIRNVTPTPEDIEWARQVMKEEEQC